MVEPAASASRATVAAFAITIFLSAFLLFQVQPLLSKFILPWFGGSPAVWTGAMLFFQLVLFGGYLYAHLLSKCCNSRQQLLIHLSILALAAANIVWGRLLPPEALRPQGLAGENPLLQVLLLLAVTVGLPYFVLSSTGPLLQRWFHDATKGASPYRLFALSNLGSLLALLSYPFFFEIHLGVIAQALGWSLGYLIFVACCGYCAVLAWRTSEARELVSSLRTTAGSNAKDIQPPSIWDRATWLLLPALASMLFLAFTNEVCQNVASVPLLWVVPLSLYLLSFIIAFDHPRWYSRLGFASAVLLLLVLVTQYDFCLSLCDTALNGLTGRTGDAAFYFGSLWWLQAACYFLALFAVATLCHGELARARPAPQHLTSFYLSMSFGGALGGLFVNLAAPHLFQTFFEFPIGLFLAAAVATGLAIVATRHFANRKLQLAIRGGAVILGLISICGLVSDQFPNYNSHRTVYVARNFYGTVDVMHRSIGKPTENYTFYSGTIQHGKQLADPAKRHLPIAYYGDGSGCAAAIEYAQSRTHNCRIGVVGLGVGMVATFARESDSIRFYEINPEVIRIAQDTRWFHFLSDCKCRPELVLGDARLQLENELRAGNKQQFDVLVMDAFSGDSVPTHLLTREACGIYLQHLKPDGILVFNITNTHLDLHPVINQLADHFELGQRRIYRVADYDRLLNRNYFVLLSRDTTFLKHMQDQTGGLPEYLRRPRRVPIWTDDYTNLTSLLR